MSNEEILNLQVKGETAILPSLPPKFWDENIHPITGQRIGNKPPQTKKINDFQSQKTQKWQ
tara:strand:+ start:24644 stop:24826 length:183 start_codon:yes stop_codon:yes gene_type:complete